MAAPPPRPVSALVRKHGAVVTSYRNDSSPDPVPGVAGGPSLASADDDMLVRVVSCRRHPLAMTLVDLMQEKGKGDYDEPDLLRVSEAKKC